MAGGCASSDLTRPPTDPSGFANESVSMSASATQLGDVSAVLADAIDRLVPSLGPRGAGLGAPLGKLRDSDRLEATLIDATLRQLEALEKVVPPESIPDADALAFALGELRGAAK